MESIGSIGKSDHVAIVFDLNLNAKSTSKQLVYDYRRADWSGMKEQMTRWMDTFAEDCRNLTADECSRNLVEALRNAESDFIPKKMHRAG